MTWFTPDTTSGSGRLHPIPALVLGGVLIVTGALSGCQKSETDTSRAEAPAAAVNMSNPSRASVASNPDTARTRAVASSPAPAVKVKASADPKETYTLGMTAYRERRYADAQTLFRAYVDAKPEQGFARTMLGLSAWKSGDPVTAEAELGIALKADAKNDRARFNLARVYLDTKRPARALELVAAHRDNAEAMRLAGRAHHQEGRSEEALSAYRRALTLDDGDAWSMNNMALIHIEREHFEEALAPLARAIELRGDVAFFHNNLGVALERTGSYAASAEQYAAAVRLDAAQEHAEASRLRVAALTGAGKPAPDMTLLADQFENAIDAWRSSEMAGREEDRK